MSETIYDGHKFPGDPNDNKSMRAYFQLMHDLELDPDIDLTREEKVAYLDMTPDQLYRGMAQRHAISEEEAAAICAEYEEQLLAEVK